MHFTHVANPVRVCAIVITKLSAPPSGHEPGAVASLADGSTAFIDAGMLARYTPVEGDYFVTQQDGYAYVNPKDVFERKYRALELNEEFDELALSLELSGHRSEIATRDRRIAELEAQLSALASQAQERAANTAMQVRAQIMSQVIAQGGGQPLKRAREAVEYILTGAFPEGT